MSPLIPPTNQGRILSNQSEVIFVSPYAVYDIEDSLAETHLYKIQASGQQIEYLKKLQINCKINEPLWIPLHHNV